MDSYLRGSVSCPLVRARQVGVYSKPIRLPRLKAEHTFVNRRRANVCYNQKSRKREVICCSFSSSSDADGSLAKNPNGNDTAYVNSSVMEAVGFRSGPDGFTMKMRDGRLFRCAHNTPLEAHCHDYAMHPAIILKMEDETGLLLPIIVSEMPSILLMAAVCNVPISRPTVYQLLKEMNEKMGYRVKLVRVTKRVHGAYIAELHVAKVPLQVSKILAHTDGMKVIETPKVSAETTSTSKRLSPEMDRPTGHKCSEMEEFDLITNMLHAADEERFKDAAMWRDKLTQLRSLRNWA